MENLRREKLYLYVLIGKTASLLLCDCHSTIWKGRSAQNVGGLKQNFSSFQESLPFHSHCWGGAEKCLSSGRRLEPAKPGR